MGYQWEVKIVPDDEPNADGEWFKYNSDLAPNYGTIVRKGWHIVKIHENQPLNAHQIPHRY